MSGAQRVKWMQSSGCRRHRSLTVSRCQALQGGDVVVRLGEGDPLCKGAGCGDQSQRCHSKEDLCLGSRFAIMIAPLNHPLSDA